MTKRPVTLAELMRDAPLRGTLPAELASRLVSGLAYDSRRVEPGFLFFAFPGAKTDGRQFAGDAVSRGALAVVSESPQPEGFPGHWVETKHGRQTLALASKEFFGRLDEKIHVIGVTGTNGKTTIVFEIDSILRAAKRVTAMIGTIEYRVGPGTLRAVNTTPESLDIHTILAELDAAGGTHLAMEASSHALALGRTYGIHFQVGVFTNLTRDHLDFHPTMEDYFAAKRLLLEGAGAPPPPFLVLNYDDEWARRIEVPEGSEVLWYGLSAGAGVRARKISSTIEGLRFEVEHGGGAFPVESRMVGRINVSNILAACAVGLAEGLTPEEIASGVAALPAVPGRFERIDEGQDFAVVVDYAHTEDALRNTIAIARDLTRGRVITLFGCGGDRDRKKRPGMGMAAAEGSEFVVLTSDNPRSEDPLAIMNDALVGLRRFDTAHVVEPDRATAILRAISEARKGDIVILAGKGHETYQELRTGRIDFDDREVARKVLRAQGYERAPDAMESPQ